MPSLQSLVDNMCANFTAESLYDLVRTRLAGGPSTVGDIAGDIAGKDRSLDLPSAQILAEATVAALTESGVIATQGAYLYPVGSLPGQGESSARGF